MNRVECPRCGAETTRHWVASPDPKIDARGPHWKFAQHWTPDLTSTCRGN